MTRRQKALVTASLLSTLYAGCLIYLGFAANFATQGRIWAGYYTLAVPERFSESEVLGRLEAQGLAGVVTESGTTVRVTAFSHVEEVPLGEIDDRLEPGDPRYDPYIRRLPALFRATGSRESYRLFFLPAESGILGTVATLNRALKPEVHDWFLVDFAGVNRWVALGGISLVVLALIAMAKKRRGALLFFCLPWLLGTLSVGGAWPVVGGAGCIAGFVFLASAEDPKSIGRFLAPVALAAALLVGVRSAGLPVSETAIALGASVLALGIRIVLRRRRSLGRDHRLFALVRIVPQGAAAEEKRLERALILLPVMALLGVVLTLLPAGRDIEVPAPAALSALDERPAGTLGAGDPDPDNPELERLQRLWVETRDAELPNLSDFLAHVAYQQGFAYGADYDFPTPEEPLTLLEIREENGRLVEATRVAAVYDNDWAEEVLSSVPQGSIERVLVQQRISTGVVRTPLNGLYSSTSHLIVYFAVLLAAYSPIMIGVLILRLRGSRVRGGRSVLGRLNHGIAPYLPQRGNSSI